MLKFLYYLSLILILLERLNDAEFRPLVYAHQINLGLMITAFILFVLPFINKFKMNRLVKQWQEKMEYTYKGRIAQVQRVKGIIAIVIPMFGFAVMFVLAPVDQQWLLKGGFLLLALLSIYQLKYQYYFVTGNEFMVLFANYYKIISYKDIRELSFKEAHLMINTRQNDYYVLDLKDYSDQELQQLFVLLNKVAQQYHIKLDQALLNA